MSQLVCSVSKTNLKLMLTLLLVPVNPNCHPDVWEKGARVCIFLDLSGSYQYPVNQLEVLTSGNFFLSFFLF